MDDRDPHEKCLTTIDRALEAGLAFKEDADRYKAERDAAFARLAELEKVCQALRHAHDNSEGTNKAWREFRATLEGGAR